MSRKPIDPEQDEPCENFSVRLSYKQYRIACKRGGGNFSKGVQDLLNQAAKDLACLDVKKPVDE